MGGVAARVGFAADFAACVGAALAFGLGAADCAGAWATAVNVVIARTALRIEQDKRITKFLLKTFQWNPTLPVRHSAINLA
jgi:hypothetical protein